MPEKLDRCVKKVTKQGYDKSRAYAICSKATGWVKGKGGKWVKKKKKNEVMVNDKELRFKILRDDFEMVENYLDKILNGLTNSYEQLLILQDYLKGMDFLERELRGAVRTAAEALREELEMVLDDEYKIGSFAYLKKVLLRIKRQLI